MNQLIKHEVDAKAVRFKVATTGLGDRDASVGVNVYPEHGVGQISGSVARGAGSFLMHATPDECDAISEMFAEAAKLLRAGQQKAA